MRTCVCVQSLSHVWLHDPMDCSTLGFSVPHHLLGFAQIQVHCSGDAIQPSHLLLPYSLLLSIFPRIGSFSMSALVIRWPQYWSFSFGISVLNEYSNSNWLISCKVDWFDLLEVQGNLKSLPQHYSLKAAVLQYSAFFMIKLSQPWEPTSFKFIIAFRCHWIFLSSWALYFKIITLMTT